ncbi:MAG: GTPase [Candidatus Aminicenantales bacterium]
MPANLPPQYFETEKKLKTARTPQEKIEIYEELLSIVPKHKGTEKLRSLLRTKIAKLKQASLKKPAVARHSTIPYVEKSGAGQVILIGPPNSGKSSLIKCLTNAQPEIGDYPYTTRTPYPAMMKYQNIQIQLVDTPPIMKDYMENWLPELIKVADAVLLVLGLDETDPAETLASLVAKLKERKIVLFSQERGQESPEDTRFFRKKTLVVANKKDIQTEEEKLSRLKEFLRPTLNILAVSAPKGQGLEELREQIFRLLDVIRVYSKVPGRKPDFDVPFTLKKGSSVLDLAKAVHKDFWQNLKYARIWSKNTYQGQKVNRDHILEDEDIIELHI